MSGIFFWFKSVEIRNKPRMIGETENALCVKDCIQVMKRYIMHFNDKKKWGISVSTCYCYGVMHDMNPRSHTDRPGGVYTGLTLEYLLHALFCNTKSNND